MDSITAYAHFAGTFLQQRDQLLTGFKVVSQWVHSLPEKAEVIEIACGGGYPVTQGLVEAGLRLWAIDSSKTLIQVFQSRFPDIPCACEGFQQSYFFGRKFDAAIAIGLVFLLPKDEQILFFNRISDVIKPEGRLLFTAPVEIGRWQDMNTGCDCLSLGYKKYQAILEESGFPWIASYEDKGKNHYYEAERVG